MSLSNGSKTEFSPEDSGMKVEKQCEIRAMKPGSSDKKYNDELETEENKG